MAEVRLRDGRIVVIRMGRERDISRVVDFYRRQSRDTIVDRFLTPLKNVEAVVEKIFAPGNVVMVAESVDGRVVGVAEAVVGGEKAEVAVVVDEGWRRVGLGSELLRRLGEVLRRRGVKSIYAYAYAHNVGVKMLAKKFGAKIRYLGYGVVFIEIPFGPE